MKSYRRPHESILQFRSTIKRHLLVASLILISCICLTIFAFKFDETFDRLDGRYTPASTAPAIEAEPGWRKFESAPARHKSTPSSIQFASPFNDRHCADLWVAYEVLCDKEAGSDGIRSVDFIYTYVNGTSQSLYEARSDADEMIHGRRNRSAKAKLIGAAATKRHFRCVNVWVCLLVSAR